jgi:hypothetical protein
MLPCIYSYRLGSGCREFLERALEEMPADREAAKLDDD